jgi:predicted AlkP superfamily phosphohydrolase/phosphomutase
MGTIHIYENDTGPDDANHAEEGIFIWTPPKGMEPRRAEKYSIYDVAPTVLRVFGIEPPEDMIGESLV